MILYKSGFWIRLAASFLDGLIIGIPTVIIAGLLTGNYDSDEPIAQILSSLYAIFLPVYWYGRTVGKRICGIRIQMYDTQESPKITTMLMRVLVAGIVYVLTLGIGIIVSAFMVGMREDRRAIHDFIAGTEVVWD
ncbi:RDD family protein [Paenibacillus xylanexedens]|uniref:RDD family protein n=1 Tax=Paenibacillus xylanexedens TaxID=528191 RepID=UPI0011A7B366|nr:RDD family protein [Paenibacillus xylanexedens]